MLLKPFCQGAFCILRGQRTWYDEPQLPRGSVLLEGKAVRRFPLICLVLVLCVVASPAAEDTPAAAKTRKLLKEKVTVDYKDTKMAEIKDDLENQVKGLKIKLDTAGGVSMNQQITFQAKDKPLEEVLDEMFKKPQLGYVVISKKGNAYDGSLHIKKSSERGFEAGQEPDKAAAKKDDKNDKKKPTGKDKAEPKEKPKTEPKDEPKEKETKPPEDEEEKTASPRPIRA